MSLNGIDVSSWQGRLDPARMRGTDFIIVKATQGTGYVSPVFAVQADGTLRARKLLGVYHYADGSGAQAEARYFVNVVRGYVHRALLAVDWESGGNRAWGNMGYLKALVAEVIRLTGVRPLIYASASVYRAVKSVADSLNCGLWIAQYATTAPTYGWQAHPWNEGAYACAIRQYADNGRIPGYGAGLDQDLFYGDRNSWLKYQGNSERNEVEVIDNNDLKRLAQAVWNYGIGRDAKAGDHNLPAWQRLSWINSDTGNLKKTLLRTDDAGTKNGVHTDVYTRVTWTGNFVKQILRKLDSMEQEIQDLKANQKEANNG